MYVACVSGQLLVSFLGVERSVLVALGGVVSVRMLFEGLQIAFDTTVPISWLTYPADPVQCAGAKSVYLKNTRKIANICSTSLGFALHRTIWTRHE